MRRGGFRRRSAPAIPPVDRAQLAAVLEAPAPRTHQNGEPLIPSPPRGPDTGKWADANNGFTDPCEWNPTMNRPAYGSEVHARATTIIGADGKLRACEACAALPKFDRFKKRPIVRARKEPTT